MARVFSKISHLWPIHPSEMKLFWLMSAMLVCLSLNHVIIHDIKDTLVVGHVGPSFVAFLKFWVVIPGAIFFFLGYAKLSEHFSQKTLLRAILVFYALFFIIFAFLIYPNSAIVYSTEPSTKEPISFIGDLIVYWKVTLFYLLGELWGNVVLGLLFWGFANRLVRLSVARRFYVPLNLSTAIATIFGGFLNLISSSGLHSFLNYSSTIKILSVILVISIFVGLFFYHKILASIDEFPRLTQKWPERILAKKESSFIASIRTIIGSPYLFQIALMVVCFGLVYNLIEIIWKYELRQAFPSMNEYSSFLGSVTIFQGIISFFVIAIGSGFTSKLGWHKSALATPIVLSVTSCSFFLFVILKRNSFLPIYSWIGVLPVYLGALHFIAVRTCRLAFFEPSKEMLFIPLTKTFKTQGKSAVDVVGDRLGKGGGSLIQHTLISVLGGVANFIPYAFFLSLGFLIVWFYTTFIIASSFSNTAEKRKEEVL